MITSPTRGFAGLISLLIAMLIISLLVWRSDLFASKPKDSSPAIDQASGSPGLIPIIAPASIQGQQQAIKNAQTVVNQIEKQSRDAAAQ